MKITTVLLPTRPQIDTLVALFILRTFGESQFPNIKEAVLEMAQTLPAGESEESLLQKGIIIIDIGGGRFDHHGKNNGATASSLVAEHLNAKGYPALAKMLEFARRDDQEGKGIISNDALDRAFGLPGLLTVLNKKYVNEPSRVAGVVLPMLEAHYEEEVKRTEEMPREFNEKIKSGKAEEFTVRQRDKKLKVVYMDSDNASMAGFLRSQLGGAHDVVVQKLSSGHVNVLTRPTKRVDLRSLVVLIRLEEATIAGVELTNVDPKALAAPGRIDQIPEWYYDTVTNSFQNGGLNTKGVPATKIPLFTLRKLLEVGLGEQLWSPLG